MAGVIGQRYELYNYERVKEEIPKRGEIIIVRNTPDFGETPIKLIGNAQKTVETLYKEWKNGEGFPFRTAEQQDVIDAETLSEAKNYTDRAQLATQTWLSAVRAVADLPITDLNQNINYLCRVIADPDQSKNGVYQCIAGWEDELVWSYFGDNADFIDPFELAEAVNEHNESESSHADIREQIDALSPEGLENLPAVLAGKADKVTGAVEGNLAALDGEGNLTDSGLSTVFSMHSNMTISLTQNNAEAELAELYGGTWYNGSQRTLYGGGSGGSGGSSGSDGSGGSSSGSRQIPAGAGSMVSFQLVQYTPPSQGSATVTSSTRGNLWSSSSPGSTFSLVVAENEKITVSWNFTWGQGGCIGILFQWTAGLPLSSPIDIPFKGFSTMTVVLSKWANEALDATLVSNLRGDLQTLTHSGWISGTLSFNSVELQPNESLSIRVDAGSVYNFTWNAVGRQITEYTYFRSPL
jgi:hypothetical protein